MKKPFMLFEDNGDGTITTTAYLGGDTEEHTLLIPMDFNDIMNLSELFPGATLAEAQEKANDMMIEIPNEPPNEGE